MAPAKAAKALERHSPARLAELESSVRNLREENVALQKELHSCREQYQLLSERLRQDQPLKAAVSRSEARKSFRALQRQQVEMLLLLRQQIAEGQQAMHSALSEQASRLLALEQSTAHINVEHHHIRALHFRGGGDQGMEG